MWIPYTVLSVLTASYVVNGPMMLPVEQLSGVAYCKYGDPVWEVRAKYIRAAHLEAMAIAYKNPDVKGYPSEITPSQIEPEPKWNTKMRQYPVTIPGGPNLKISPFRVVFSEPEILDDKNQKIVLSKFWNVT
ncbi:hypothetical protein FRC12_024780 [Ceratobasidium sp. 428]|nr:hypothetical protein FRC12_024780 [Ceratobasidium sp. 428]